MSHLMQRYRMMLEDHNPLDNTVTRKEVSLLDIMNIVGSIPGTVGKRYICREVTLQGAWTPIESIPKGANITSVAMHVHHGPDLGYCIGTRKEAAKFGKVEKAKAPPAPTPPVPGKKEEPTPPPVPPKRQFAKKSVGEVSDDTLIGVNVEGLGDDDKIDACVHVMVTYEVMNPLDD